MPRWRWLAVATLLVACSAFSAEEAPPGSAPDAGTDAAPSDGAATDGASPSDAGGCGWGAFVDGFERATVEGTWTAPTSLAANDARLFLADGGFDSGRSLASELSPFDGGFRAVYLERPVVAPEDVPAPTCIELSFMLAVAAFPIQSGVTVASLELQNDAAFILQIDADEKVSVAYQTFAPNPNPTFTPLDAVKISVSTWVKVTLRSSGADVTFDVGGTSRTAQIPGFALPVRVRVGVVTGRQSVAAYLIDDVSLN